MHSQTYRTPYSQPTESIQNPSLSNILVLHNRTTSNRPSRIEVNPQIPLRRSETNPPARPLCDHHPLPSQIILLIVAPWTLVRRRPARASRLRNIAIVLAGVKVGAGEEIHAVAARAVEFEPMAVCKCGQESKKGLVRVPFVAAIAGAPVECLAHFCVANVLVFLVGWCLHSPW